MIKLLLLSALAAPNPTFQDNQHKFSFDYDRESWEIAPEKPQSRTPLDKTTADGKEQTLVTIQKKNADEKYHARFSVVLDSSDKFKEKGPAKLVAYHKYAADFLRKNNFRIQRTELIKLPKIEGLVGEVVADHKDFGLTFRQIVIVRGENAYLLTAAMRTSLYEDQSKEASKFFDSFHFE